MLMRTVRRIDDVLEVLLFDVALATPRRRRIAAGLTGLAGLALYLCAGMMFTPRAPLPPDPPRSAPYIDDATWTSPAPVVAETATDLKLTPERLRVLDAEFEKYAGALSRLRSLLATDAVRAMPATPWFRTVREAGNLLVARGLVRASRGDGNEAVQDWLAAARLGLAVTGRRTEGVTLIDGMIGTAIERRALSAIQQHIDSKPVSITVRLALASYLAARPDRARNLTTYIQGERAYVDRIMAHAVTRGSLDLDGSTRGMNVFMPSRHADRVAFLTEVRARLRGSYDAMLAGSAGNKVRALSPEELERIAGGGPPVDSGALSCVQGMFSRSHAIGVVSHLILKMATPNIARAGERIDVLDEQVRRLRAQVPMPLQGI